MSRSTVARLRSTELFASCRRRDVEIVDRLGVTLDVPAGRRLCTEGAAGAEFFVLLAGAAEVHTAAGAAAILRRGAWFGETALLRGAARRATVDARTDATLIVFGAREFKALLRILPDVHDRLERTAGRVVSGRTPTNLPWYLPLTGRTRVAAGRPT